MPSETLRLAAHELQVSSEYRHDATVTLYHGDCLALLGQIPDGAASLIVTSPPYNLGKEYERKNSVDAYIEMQSRTIAEAVRICAEDGSICWQVGNYVENGEIAPLDILLYPTFVQHGLKLRNRVVWHFEHGLHCTKRFSGRYEVILWFTKSDAYYFDLDAVRVPQKYQSKKHFKGPKAGALSCNPKGKNPGDLWIIPNVKANHREKTAHPCQYPIALVERLVLSLTRPGDLVVDPYLGAGTSAVAAVMRGRRAAGADTVAEYLEIARQRIAEAIAGTVPYRPLDMPVYNPSLPNGGHDR
ncbi:MAG: site-specific DNA-methyltransferase [Armatimonadetes bacterium]|nr:site-specific DNA-methyltransferase [Armatimonadota bacterium]